MAKLYSKRGFLLVDEPGLTPTLTVELYCKWYTLHLVHADGLVMEVPFPEDTYMGEPAYFDHAPNPGSVKRYAEAQGYEVGELAYELMVGRWQLEFVQLRWR